MGLGVGGGAVGIGWGFGLDESSGGVVDGGFAGRPGSCLPSGFSEAGGLGGLSLSSTVPSGGSAGGFVGVVVGIGLGGGLDETGSCLGGTYGLGTGAVDSVLSFL